MRKNNFVTGYLWNVLGRVGISLLSVISTLLLVRLLSPEDFGLVAIAVMVLGLFEVLSEMSIERYIILNQFRCSQKVNAAWSLDIVIKLVVIVVAFLLAGPIASYYQEPELKFAIEVLAVMQIFKVFKNIGLAIEKMDMNFKLINKILVQAKLAGTITTISLAFLLQDYRALIIGTFVNIVVETLLSYKYCSYRPKFSTNFERNMVTFSSKLLIRNIFGYVRSKLDVALLGAGYGTTGTGKYLVSQKFALMAQRDLIAPAAQPLFSELSRSKNSEDLYQKSYKYLTILNFVLLPIIVGINILSIQIETVILGPKWIGTADIIGNLATLMLPFSLIPVLNNLFDHEGKPATSIIMDTASIGLILFCFYILNPADENEFSLYRAAVGIVIYVFMIMVARLTIKLSLKMVFQSLVIPFLGSLAMLQILNLGFTHDLIRLNDSLLSMLLNAAIGALVYIVVVAVLVIVLKKYLHAYQHVYLLVCRMVKARLN